MAPNTLGEHHCSPPLKYRNIYMMILPLVVPFCNAIFEENVSKRNGEWERKRKETKKIWP